MAFGWSNVNSNTNVPLIGTQAPSFTAESTNGRINFPADFGNNWKIIFAHPKDFTPVCSSELLELAYEQESFDRLGTRILVLSTDLLSPHFTWKKALEEVSYKDRDPVSIKFPLVDDNSFSVSNKYGMIHPEAGIGVNIKRCIYY